MARRLLTIPGYFIAWGLWVAALPVWLTLALVVDLVRGRRFATLRGAAMVTAYLSCEVAGLIASAAVWAWRAVFGMSEQRWRDVHFALEAWWGSTLLSAVERCFGLRVRVEGDAELSRGPYLLLCRHASSADTLLASKFVSRATGMRLRYVLKRELLFDPCLDVVGHRLPNVFVERGSGDSASEVERVAEIGKGLGARDGVLIYPEGTRFTVEKRERIVERLEQAGDARRLADARALTSVLPPRTGGVIALLDAAPSADVVVCVHAGFERVASLADVFNGGLVGREIRIAFWRIRRSEVPKSVPERVEWLQREWRRVDDWVGDALASDGSN